MKAGRELDALVGQKVMGWTRAYDRRLKGEWWSAPEDPQGFYADFPEWSTDISAAWVVVEKMRERGFWFRMSTPFSLKGTTLFGGFTSHNSTGWNGRPDYGHAAESAPEVICLAALKACGVEVPK